MNRVLASLGPADRVIVLSLALTLCGVVVSALLTIPGVFGITAILVMSLILAGAALTRSARLAWLIPFGLVAGLLELWADWIHVEQLGSLVYTDCFGFRFLASPSYMPVGWWLTVVQFGYIALRLTDRWPAWAAVATVSVLGMSIPPWYEEFAASARAWYYTTTGPTVGHTPIWIILTYGGCMSAIGTMAIVFYRPRAWSRAVVAGIFTAAGFMFSGVFWYAVVG